MLADLLAQAKEPDSAIMLPIAPAAFPIDLILNALNATLNPAATCLAVAQEPAVSPLAVHVSEMGLPPAAFEIASICSVVT